MKLKGRGNKIKIKTTSLMKKIFTKICFCNFLFVLCCLGCAFGVENTIKQPELLRITLHNMVCGSIAIKKCERGWQGGLNKNLTQRCLKIEEIEYNNVHIHNSLRKVLLKHLKALLAEHDVCD